MHIVFMGTPDFAVPSLQALIDAGHEITAVFTQTDKPKGRKQILTPPPVKELALRHAIPVFQPKTLKSEEAQESLRGLSPEAIVVAAYGKILPKAVLDLPKYGCINVHASLLPKYRGAAPIQWSILNGEAETGVTTMFMAEGIDTGDILFSERTPIDPDETADMLTERLSHLGAKLIVRTLERLEEGTAVRIPQDEANSSYVKMLDRELSGIDWNRTAREIHNQVRGLNPWPVAETRLKGKRLKIYRTRVIPAPAGMAGQISRREDGIFVVGCGGETSLELLEVQPENGKRMSGTDFLRGRPNEDGNILE